MGFREMLKFKLVLCLTVSDSTFRHIAQFVGVTPPRYVFSSFLFSFATPFLGVINTIPFNVIDMTGVLHAGSKPVKPLLR